MGGGGDIEPLILLELGMKIKKQGWEQYTGKMKRGPN
jgi:hypothetical protein